MDPSTDYHSNQVPFATEIKPTLECSGMSPYSSAIRYREDIYTKSENSPVGNKYVSHQANYSQIKDFHLEIEHNIKGKFGCLMVQIQFNHLIYRTQVSHGKLVTSICDGTSQNKC